MGALIGTFGKFAQERIGSVISKKVGAGATGIILAAGGQHEAGYAALGYAAIQAAFDGWKYYVDSRGPNKSLTEQKPSQLGGRP